VSSCLNAGVMDSVARDTAGYMAGGIGNVPGQHRGANIACQNLALTPPIKLRPCAGKPYSLW